MAYTTDLRYRDFYSAAALLTMQSAVLATAIPSVCPSHAGILPCGLSCELNETLYFYDSKIGWGDVPLHLKYALKPTHHLSKAPTSTNICL